MQTWGQKLSDLGNGALIMILEPVWTLLLSTLFMAENLSTTKIMGSTFVLSALLIYRLNVMRQK
ncbi:RhaT protein [Bibersteinia trehalosi USDA-ARS-USMARC-190]|uniref:RhaT protein n=1 Tax=Bibersteinia trehalosi USDA-ARS-USMARC-190 TaxID=1263832 RepID=W0R4A2_BIBTR|nr:EamA family transporter [Bibersteinia trehalosi]AHG85267.1 RhaT protein [Bibersteinia trehalosi USDA-ARS-USMARC-190]